MECAVCKAKVDDFKIHKPGEASPIIQQKDNIPEGQTVNIFDAYQQSFGAPLNKMDYGFQDFLDRAQGASTPVASKRNGKTEETAVLRIDNVPWVRGGLAI